MLEPRPGVLTGVFAFEGRGFDTSVPLGDGAAYTAPADRRSQLIYVRAGNSSAELVALILTRDGLPFRIFPVGARASLHVALAVVEDLFPGTRIDVMVAAPSEARGHVVLDIGFLEM